jgi:decaprenylphospho-beta-D-erythro-pentofuranosid-2-ulose 2-reductase
MPAVALPEPRLWLVLGASSAIARAFVRLVAASGGELILAGRDLADMERSAADARVHGAARVEVRRFDAAEGASHAAFVAALPDRPLNVLLAFGLMHPQAAIDRDPSLAEQVIAVNYQGAVSILARLEPRLAAAGQGAVVVVSSVAGDRGRPSNFVYGSAKAGLNVYLQGLRARLSHSGVAVTTIKAGFMDTAMTYGLPGMFLVASPEAAARACLKAAARKRNLLYFPVFWWLIMGIIKAIPEALFKRLKL